MIFSRKIGSFDFMENVLVYTRRESNSHRRNRNPVFYPLNYGCIQ